MNGCGSGQSVGQRRLARQLRRLHAPEHQPPDARQWPLVQAAVAAAYDEADNERLLHERAAAISSAELAHLHAELAASRTRRKAVFDALDLGMCMLDEQGRFIALNRAACDLLGTDEEALVGSALWDVLTLTDADSGVRFGAEGYRAVLERAELWRCEHMTAACQARRCELAVSVAPLAGNAYSNETGAVLLLRDIARELAATEALRWLAEHDSGTGLPNRRLFERGLDDAAPADELSAVLFLDLDRFKQVNDTLGHAVGDELLALVARRIEHQIRPGDMVARLAGDEFAVLLRDVSPDAAVDVARRVVAAVSEAFQLSVGTVHISASVGVAFNRTADSETLDASALLSAADYAMYQAKLDGRDRVRVYGTELAERARMRVLVESELRDAIANGEIRAEFQPQVDLASGRLVAVEALARWRRADGSMIPPDQFIPIAEETGLVHELGRLILRHACQLLASFAAASGDATAVSVAVNVSGVQLVGSDLAIDVITETSRWGVAPSLLTFEVTESVLLSDPDRAQTQLERLHGLGVRLSMDDFGTGHSSLENLRRFPFSEVKIDRSFVKDLPADGRDRKIVQAILALASAMDQHVVAEGVETTEQQALLARLGTHIGQGWLYGKAMPAEELLALIAARAPFAA